MSMASIFAESQHLPHIPKVVQELIESFRDDNIDADKISDKVALDQALTAKVLRLANSAHYGVSRTIANPHDAIMLLGFNTLRTMVLASGVSGAFKPPQGFDQKAFWRDAFTIAALSRFLASYTPDCDKGTAFTCGMLHSIGQLLIRIVMPAETASIDEAEKLGGTRHTLESGQLGFSSAEVGAELAKRWKFPQEMQQAIEQQYNPGLEKPYTQLAGILYLARFLKQAREAQQSDDEIRDTFPRQVAQSIALDSEAALADLAALDSLSSGLDGLLE